MERHSPRRQLLTYEGIQTTLPLGLLVESDTGVADETWVNWFPQGRSTESHP